MNTLKNKVAFITGGAGGIGKDRAKYQVRGVPTMLLFKNGKQLWRPSGVLQKKIV